MENKQYYYLMSGKVIYDIKDSNNKTTEYYREINTICITDNNFVNIKDIGQTQQAMQVRFHNEFVNPSPNINIKDVFILSCNYLGFMTSNEFNKPVPESMSKIEDKPAQEAVENTAIEESKI